MSFDPIRFVEENCVVLESAKGPVPNLAEALTETPIRESWWIHPMSKKSFRATRLVRDNDRVLVCRLVGGKVTYVHRRLWPALIRLARYFEKDDLAAIREAHSPAGAHVIKKLPFPKRARSNACDAARALSEDEAAALLGPWAMAVLRSRRSPSPSGQAGK